MKGVKLMTLLLAVFAMTAYVKAENYQSASSFFAIFSVISWTLFLPTENCLPLIANTYMWGPSNPFRTVGKVCIDVVEKDGVLVTSFAYTVEPGYSITRAFSGVHRNCQIKKVFPYQRSARLPTNGTSVTALTQYVGFDEYDCPADFPDGCCNRRNCFSPKLRVRTDLPGFPELTAFPADDPSGPAGCRTVNGLRRCLTTLSCSN